MSDDATRRRFDVLVCGSLHLDIVVRAPRLPRMDETAVGTAWNFACGGKGRNQAMQAAAVGARVAMIGRVGRDAFADSLLESLDAAGVDRRHVIADAATGSGMSVAIVDPAGDYGAVIVSGANLAIDPAWAEAAVTQLEAAPILVLQNEIPEAVNIAAARANRRRGGRVVLNAAPARPTSAALLDLVDILVVNRVEAAQLAGIAVEDAAAAVRAATTLAGAARAVIVTLGAAGLVIVPPDGEATRLAATPVRVVSTHGAGDCFVGTLAARLSQGMDLANACRAASTAAARHVAGDGSTRPMGGTNQ
jgi:ribokinase